MVDWNLALSVAVGVLVGTFTVVTLILLVIWVIDRVEKWREGRKAEIPDVTGRRAFIELTSQNHDLQRRLRESEADRRRLEVIARGLLEGEASSVEEREEPVQVRTRYERLIASD